MVRIETIIANARQSKKQLTILEARLQKEIRDIENNAYDEDRELTAEELTICAERLAQKLRARKAYVALARLNLRRLNQSEDVKELTLSMKKINKSLEKDLETLQKIERYAATAAKVSDGLARIGKRVAAIVA